MPSQTSVPPLDLSREACVSIASKSNDSRGSGFLIAPGYVVTCFHVAARLAATGNRITWTIPSDLTVTLDDGETMSGTCISVPTDAEPQPVVHDFAVIRLATAPAKPHRYLTPSQDTGSTQIGDEVAFSGFPLGVPAMVTHRGMISGWDDPRDLFCIQASINKGNSGGALIGVDGSVIGIVSMREGGISKGLAELNEYIAKSASHGSVAIMGVDPLQSIRAITQTLDTYISTGIGYARNIRYLNDYLRRHPLPDGR